MISKREMIVVTAGVLLLVALALIANELWCKGC